MSAAARRVAGAGCIAAAGRIAAVSLTCADASALAEFYVTLGFQRSGVELRGGPAFARLMLLPRAEARVILLRLGAEWLELVSFAQPGRPYPGGGSSNDPWFQHFAIVVASMEDALARLNDRTGWTPITRPAPQRLPASSGGVTAFKFRDPEGHPLELLEFPQDRMPPVWRARREALPTWRGASTRPSAAPSPFLGIDHSAIVVASTARSLEFYERRLGFERTGASINRGPEQARLDGLAEPEIEVTALAAPVPRPPHLELLCYRAPPSRAAFAGPLASHDIAATRLALDVEQWEPTDGALCGALIHDPDGHALLLERRTRVAGS